MKMKTTLVIDDQVIRRLKQEAARQGTTMSALAEAALRLWFENAKKGRRKPKPLPAFHAGRLLVDIADREALYNAMEGRSVHG
jgi:hypothetical protein